MSSDVETVLWMLGRGTGIVALVLLTVSVCLGITVRSRVTLGPLPRWGTTELHRTASLTGCGLVATHVLTLLLDPQAGLRLLDLVIPFIGAYRPFWLGLGTLALELLVLVAVTGLLRKRIGEKAFRAAHLTSYALWPVALGHSLGTGTDAGTLGMDALAITCALAVTAAVWWRIGPEFGKAKPAVRPGATPAP